MTGRTPSKWNCAIAQQQLEDMAADYLSDRSILAGPDESISNGSLFWPVKEDLAPWAKTNRILQYPKNKSR